MPHVSGWLKNVATEHTVTIMGCSPFGDMSLAYWGVNLISNFVICMCCVCFHVCEYMHVYMESRVDIMYFPLEHSTIFFEKISHRTGNHCCLRHLPWHSFSLGILELPRTSFSE